MTARDDNFRTTGTIFHRDYVGTETVTDIVVFHRDSLTLRHHGFKFTEVENDIGTVEPSDGAANDFAGTIFKFLVNHLFLGLANPLHHRLLCGLRRDAPAILWRDFDFSGLADVGVRLDFARLRELDLILWIGYVINHNQICEGADFASLSVNVNVQIPRRSNALFRG